jgi:hypothetical protein
MKKCANCAYRFKQELSAIGNQPIKQQTEIKSELVCRRYPPQAVPMMVKHPITNEAAMVVQSFYPPVGADNVCGEFHGTVELAA